MPRVWEAKKDVVSCDKPGGAAHKHYIPGSPNGKTHYTEGIVLEREPTPRTETSKYREEKKTNSDSLSSGERKGNSLNLSGVPLEGCRTAFRNHHQVKSSGKLSHSRWKPCRYKLTRTSSILSNAGPEESCVNLPAPSDKAKYSSDTDSEPVP